MTDICMHNSNLSSSIHFLIIYNIGREFLQQSSHSKICSLKHYTVL